MCKKQRKTLIESYVKSIHLFGVIDNSKSFVNLFQRPNWLNTLEYLLTKRIKWSSLIFDTLLIPICLIIDSLYSIIDFMRYQSAEIQFVSN